MAKRRSGQHELRRPYKIARLTKVEYATLQWLADHGYDGDILRTAGVEEEHADGGATLGAMTEPEAWHINDYIESDPDAWLASNGSRSLADKLYAFINKIV
jgi:hypothetical protein